MEFISVNGFDVSRIGLGTWAIGGWMWGGTDEAESIRTIRAALDAGITLVDTAPVYGFGTSEKIVGKALAGHGNRSSVILSTKCGLNWQNGKVFRDCRRERLMQEIDDSLERLGTDYIDIYFVHWPDPLVPREETGATLKAILDSGKIKAVGVSNYSPADMDAFRRGGPLHLCQPPYNIFERGIEADIKPYCHERGIALMTYGALCRGLLSGKMRPGRTFTGDDLRRLDPKFQEPRYGQYLKAVERLSGLAAERFHKDLLPFAVRWVLDQGAETALWGARHPVQVGPLREVLGWTMDKDTRQRVDQILAETVTDPAGPEFMAPPTRPAPAPAAGQA